MSAGILLVEDHATMREAMRMVLEHLRRGLERLDDRFSNDAMPFRGRMVPVVGNEERVLADLAHRERGQRIDDENAEPIIPSRTLTMFFSSKTQAG